MWDIKTIFSELSFLRSCYRWRAFAGVWMSVIDGVEVVGTLSQTTWEKKTILWDWQLFQWSCGGAYIGGVHAVQVSFQPLSVIDGVGRWGRLYSESDHVGENDGLMRMRWAAVSIYLWRSRSRGRALQVSFWPLSAVDGVEAGYTYSESDHLGEKDNLAECLG